MQVIERAKNIKKIGATGAYTKEFDEMQSQLDEVEALLNSTKYIDVDEIEDKLIELGLEVNETDVGPIQELYSLLDSATHELTLANIRLQNLENDKNQLQTQIKELEANGTALQEADVQGALTIVQNAKYKADLAAQKAERSQVLINYFN